MKYVKKYEELISDGSPKIGDYVIVEFQIRKITRHMDFMETHVGQIINIRKGLVDNIYQVDFGENIPGFYFSVWSFLKDQIISFSLDKEKLEAILASKKYNL